MKVHVCCFLGRSAPASPCPAPPQSAGYREMTLFSWPRRRGPGHEPVPGPGAGDRASAHGEEVEMDFWTAGRLMGIWLYDHAAQVIRPSLPARCAATCWSSPGTSRRSYVVGAGFLVFEPDGGRFTGTWWTGDQSRSGDWNGWRVAQAGPRPGWVECRSPPSRRRGPRRTGRRGTSRRRRAAAGSRRRRPGSGLGAAALLLRSRRH